MFFTFSFIFFCFSFFHFRSNTGDVVRSEVGVFVNDDILFFSDRSIFTVEYVCFSEDGRVFVGEDNQNFVGEDDIIVAGGVAGILHFFFYFLNELERF
ncbi:unnamed protein product [Vicia faba]|uniref:Uncharacterized protein n=1 Tax=Vicia faba TaxID=3906 RepID=A0AAV1A779_VICFA|nr:unnamed protein product [Vicia faba]